LLTIPKAVPIQHFLLLQEEYIIRHLNIVRSRLNDAIRQRQKEKAAQQGQGSTQGQENLGQGQGSQGQDEKVGG